jgi:hypothetical protein
MAEEVSLAQNDQDLLSHRRLKLNTENLSSVILGNRRVTTDEMANFLQTSYDSEYQIIHDTGGAYTASRQAENIVL